MPAIQEQQWQEVGALTWGDLTDHLWQDFRSTLAETQTEQEVSGIKVEVSRTYSEGVSEVKAQGVKIVNSPTVMRTRTEMLTSIVVSERDYRSKMLSYLPTYERKSGVFNEVLKAYDREFRNEEQQLSIMEREMIPDTAIETLSISERDLGIETVPTLRYDQRREQITSRYRGSFAQTTIQSIKDVASAYSNGEVEVSRTVTPGVYQVKFVGTRGIPNNMEGLKAALEIIIPAHIELTYVYSFNVWGWVDDQTWGEVSGMTWSELRELEGVS